MININRAFIFRKRRSIETRLIQLICLMLFVLFFVISLMYYSSIQSTYAEQLDKSNSSMIEQVGISFESSMKMITNAIYKIPLYDTELVRYIDEFNQKTLAARDIYDKLTSIQLGNEYIYSCYLYLQEKNLVLCSEFGYSYPSDSFFDQAAIEAAKKDKIIVLDPRVVKSSNDTRLFISIVSPVSLTLMDPSATLIVNIDANKLYNDILKRISTEETMNFYVYDQNNTIIIAKDPMQLFKKIVPQKTDADRSYNPFRRNNSILKVSKYYSQPLKWNFVLETSVHPNSVFQNKIFSFIMYFTIIMLISLIAAVLIIKYSTRSMKEVMSEFTEKLWKDFLTDSQVDLHKFKRELISLPKGYDDSLFGVIVLQLQRPEISEELFKLYWDTVKSSLTAVNDCYIMKTIMISNKYSAIVVSLKPSEKADENMNRFFHIAQRLYAQMDGRFSKDVYISISKLCNDIRMLPKCYSQCIEMLNYKILHPTHIFNGLYPKNTVKTFEYPYELEKQLINNLIVGNSEACRLFCQKFFDYLTDPTFYLSDSEIKNYIYQLQTSVLKSISGLPVPVKIDSSLNVLDLFDLQTIKNRVLCFIDNAISEISKKGDNEESALLTEILEYIDRKFTNEDFNLNKTADDLGINKNFLSKLIKS